MDLSQTQADKLTNCLANRLPQFDNAHKTAIRLLNGFYEGFPQVIVDLYGSTLVISNHANPPEELFPLLQGLQDYYLTQLPWLKAVLVKSRNSSQTDGQRGRLSYGEQADRVIEEHGIQYTLDLRINQDTSFYLDTRNLRSWLHQNMAEKTVLNTFAYTGTLGVAALAGGATRVVQTDINARFLTLAKKSYTLNQIVFEPSDFMAMDFFKMVDRFKTSKILFDCVIIDPPFFSVTTGGKVNLNNESARLINKVRPLIGHEGWLVTINNALFVSGSQVMAQLNALCESPYIKLHGLIPIPEDVTGYPETIVSEPPTDPSPFNHPTKIAILKVFRKDERRAIL